MNLLPREKILDVFITNAPKSEILKYITTVLEKAQEKIYIVTPNPEILVYAAKHKPFQDILNQAQVALPDGIGVVMASRVLGKTIKRRITGTDFVFDLCEELSKRHGIIGFLGGRGGVAEKTAKCLQNKYPNLTIGFVGEDWKDEKVALDVLFVAYGFPKQEEWIASHLERSNVKVMMAVGGAFDYISGKIPRAPKSIRMIGLEWVFRLIMQPWRWKRQLALIEFVWRVLRAK